MALSVYSAIFGAESQMTLLQQGESGGGCILRLSTSIS